MYQPEKNQMQVFADNLTEILAKKKMSQNQLAGKIGVSAMSVNKWARAISMPRNDKIDQICQVLNVQRSDLLADKTSIPNLSIPAAYPLPILGRICCGNGVLADENFDGMFFVDNSIRADYCLRHTYASMLINAGIPIAEVSTQLGHASIDITLRTYTHLFTDASTASRRISDLLDERWHQNGHQDK